MKKILCICILTLTLGFPVSASGIVAPEVPDDAAQLMPPKEEDLGNGLRYIIKEAINQMQPQVATCLTVCTGLIGAILVFSLLRNFEGKSKHAVELAGVVTVVCFLVGNTNSMLEISTQAVWQISQYGKLLLPVMTAALAAQGGAVSAASLYGTTALFDSILCSLISSALIPIVYIFVVLAIVNAATEDSLLKRLRDLAKQAVTWGLKIILYVFTGYISITGVISGTADQTAVKAAKITISGMVPVVGGILSDASETILISAGVVKNAVGVYGLLAVIAVTIVPFLTIGIYYLSLKLTAAVCTVFAPKMMAGLIDDFSTAMGLILGMTGSVCLMQLISIVCFLKGMA